MFRGFFIGSGVAIALSVLLVAAVSLIAPLPPSALPAGEDAPRLAAVPEAPLVVASRDPVPAQPEPLPRRDLLAQPTSERAPLARAERTGRETAQASVPLPASSEFNRAPVDLDPIAPEAEEQPRPVALSTAPAGAPLPSTPTPDTSSAAQPAAVFAVAGVSAPQDGAAPTLPESVAEGAPKTFREVETGEDAPLTAEPGATAAEDLVVASARTDLDPTPEPTTPAQDDLAAAASDGLAEDPIALAPIEDAPLVYAEAIPPLTAKDLIDPTDLASPITLVEDPIDAPRRIRQPAQPAAEPATERAAPIVPRRIILDSERRADEAAAAAEEAAKNAKITVNAVPFENPDGLPLFGIILIDDGSGEVTQENLLSFNLPVTFALDPTRDGAIEAAKAYREAGHEVLMMADAIPAGGTSTDVEVAMTGALAELPDVVGVLDRQEAGFATDRATLGGLLAPMSDTGLGFVTYGGGLNSGLTRAKRAGVPATTVYRVLDEGEERATVMTRYLDRATFEAAQSGYAIVVGKASTDTVTALYSWSAGRRAASVAVAPISHILRASVE